MARTLRRLLVDLSRSNAAALLAKTPSLYPSGNHPRRPGHHHGGSHHGNAPLTPPEPNPAGALYLALRAPNSTSRPNNGRSGGLQARMLCIRARVHSCRPARPFSRNEVRSEAADLRSPGLYSFRPTVPPPALWLSQLRSVVEHPQRQTGPRSGGKFAARTGVQRNNAHQRK